MKPEIETDWKDVPPYSRRGSYSVAATRLDEAANEFVAVMTPGSWLLGDTHVAYKRWAKRRGLPMASSYFWRKAMETRGGQVRNVDGRLVLTLSLQSARSANSSN